MITFTEIKSIIEKIKIHQNKSINITFNSYKGHTLQDKLDRAKISETEFKQSLNKITKRIKSDKLESGNYAFITKQFKIPSVYNKEKKELFITTILTKSMKAKSSDTSIIIESVQYQIIYI